MRLTRLSSVEKIKNRHWGKKSGKAGWCGSSAEILVGAVKRKGNVIARVVDKVNTETLEKLVCETGC